MKKLTPAYFILSCLAFSFAAAESKLEIKKFGRSPFKTENVNHPNWGQFVTVPGKLGTLKSSRRWIYFKPQNSDTFYPILPGRCPQWIPNPNGYKDFDRRFYYFLDNGIDTELWIGELDGDAVHRVAKGGVPLISDSPILSPDGEAMAHIVRPMFSVQGNHTMVAYFRIPKSPTASIDTKVLYETRSGAYFTDLKFVDNERVSFTINTWSKEKKKNMTETKTLPVK